MRKPPKKIDQYQTKFLEEKTQAHTFHIKNKANVGWGRNNEKKEKKTS